MDQAVTQLAWIATRIPGTRDARGRKPSQSVLVGGAGHSYVGSSRQPLGTGLRETGGTPTRQPCEYGGDEC
jgi:hypothetical protein